MREPGITIEKPRLPAGRVYVLKSSQLLEALTDASIAFDIQLQFWTPQSGGSILEAFYWPPNRNVPYDRVFVRAGSVLMRDRQRAAQVLVEHALPRFVKWLKAVQALPEGSPLHSESLTFDATLNANGLSVRAKPQPN